MVDPAMSAGLPGNTKLILRDPTIHKTRTSLWHASDWAGPRNVEAVEHRSAPYQDGSHTLAPFPFPHLRSESKDRIKAIHQKRDRESPLDELVFYWTKIASKDLIAEACTHSSNTTHFLLKHIAQHWLSQLELINCTIAMGEYFSDDCQVKLDDSLRGDKWRAHLHMVSRITKDINYMRRQTLKNAERYIIPELKEYEDKVLTSKGKALALEKQLYEELFDLLLPHLEALQQSASALAELDVLVNLAERAYTLNYTCPTFIDKPGIRITEGRHPVVEQVLNEPFIANPLNLSPQRRMLIITGPNMGGKSTYMRQTALIALMAYIGSYVPAQKVEIGPIDRIFTRVGAADDLASGRSTFMVEMTETANILHNATEYSLVLMDEIGRGTSTYDGLSLAWACAENLANKIKALTLFATHYFELTQLPEKMEGVANVHLDALEHGDTIAFMHSVQDGAASKSYGLAVAALAGVPKEVIKRARQKLRELESISPNAAATQVDGTQMSLLSVPEETSPAVEALENLDPDSLTPRQALEWIYRLKSLV